LERLADLLLSRPRSVFAALMLCSVAAAAYLALGGIRFDYNLEGFLPAGDPTIQQFRAFTDAYEPDDVFVVVGFQAEDVFAYRTLRDIEGMTEALEAIDGVERVISLTSIESIRGTEFGIEVSPVLEQLSDDPEDLQALEARVRGDSLALGYIVSAAGDAAAIFIQIESERNSYEERGEIIREARAALRAWEGTYEFHWSGFPYLRNAYIDNLQVEVVRSISLATLVILLVLVWMFRSVRGVVIPIALIWLGALWTICVMMLAGSYIDVMTSSTAAIILVVAVADSIHLMTKYYDGLAGGLEKRAALRQMVVRLGSATLLTSVTTAIGFATLASSRVVPMQRFGVFTAAGVLLTFAVSLALITVLLQWTRAPRAETIRRVGTEGRLAHMLRGVDRFVERRPAAILAGAVAILAVSIVGATQLRVNTFINDDLGPRTQVYQDIRWFEDRIVSPFRFEVLLATDEPEAFLDPARLQELEQIEGFLSAQPFVTRTVSPIDLLKQLNRALHADDPAAYILPDSREAIAQYFLLLELTDEDFLRRFADFDFREVRLSAHMDDVGSARIQAFREEFDAYMATILPANVTPTSTGTIVLAADLTDYLVESLLVSIGLAFLFISILMGFLFRDVKLVIVSLVPNVAPLIVVAGIMGFAGVEIKPATAIIFSIAFGIVVDDTIHMLARLKQELKAGHDLRVALRHTIVGTGKAVVLTSVILLGGFLVLATSVFQSTMYLGLLVSAAIGLAVVADLLLLPALLYLLYPELRATPAIAGEGVPAPDSVSGR
jgi:uncharacterized protein